MVGNSCTPRYCRVLFLALYFFRFYPIHCILYTGDNESKEEILAKTKVVLRRIYTTREFFTFISKIPLAWKLFIFELVFYLKHPGFFLFFFESRYPHFTMLCQSIASMVVALDGLSQSVPDIFFDTTGLAFTYAIVKLFTASHIMSYTHYPTISTDMLQRVRERRVQYNNNAFISSSITISFMKLLYLHLRLF